MRQLVRLLRQGLVVEGARCFGVERQVELVFPAKLEPRPRQRIVTEFRRRMALGEVGGVRGYSCR